MVTIRERCYKFSLAIIGFLRSNEWDKFNMVLVNQLLRSATSIGANVIEAFGSTSRAEFKRYYSIALKSANETIYWLYLIRDSNQFNKHQNLTVLTGECRQIIRLLGASITTLKQKQQGKFT